MVIPDSRESVIGRIRILADLYFQVFNRWPDDRISAWCDRNNFDRDLSKVPIAGLWGLCNAMQKGLEKPENREKLKLIYQK
jgi:hypothetical protein